MRNGDGALSRECQELNRLYSLSVDGNRIKIDDRFTNLPPLDENVRDSFVLNMLHREAEKESQHINTIRGTFERLDSRETIETLLSQPRSCSEFLIIQMTYEWCRRTREAALREFLPYFNLAALGIEQKYWLLQQLPVELDLPALVMNGLMDSEILQPHELQPFRLDLPGMRWKRIFSPENRLANLFEVLEKTFVHFHRKLLILRISERFSIAVYISRLIEVDEEADVGQKVLVFAFTHTQDQSNSRDRIFRATTEFRLHFNHSTFQLFNRSRANTFIWIGQPGINDTPFRQTKGRANRARQRHRTVVEVMNHDWITSIALGQFSRNIQTQIGRVWRHGLSAAVKHHSF
ncbi:hypothetical protein BJX64DRAFT_136699 [Aspergillus heterothallicus]